MTGTTTAVVEPFVTSRDQLPCEPWRSDVGEWGKWGVLLPTSMIMGQNDKSARGEAGWAREVPTAWGHLLPPRSKWPTLVLAERSGA